MTQQLLSTGTSVWVGSTPEGFTSAGFTPMRAVPVALSPDQVLTALPPGASQALRDAIASGCCTHYTVSEGDCGSGGCGSGKCCYHVVSTDCGINVYECVEVPCSTGNFSTGC
jgi:hypothetical protein